MCDGEYRGATIGPLRGRRIYPRASTPSRSDRGADQLVFLKQWRLMTQMGLQTGGGPATNANSALPTDNSPKQEGDARLRHITGDAAEYSATVDNSERMPAQSQR